MGRKIGDLVATTQLRAMAAGAPTR
jgi:hypothetical protein